MLLLLCGRTEDFGYFLFTGYTNRQTKNTLLSSNNFLKILLFYLYPIVYFFSKFKQRKLYSSLICIFFNVCPCITIEYMVWFSQFLCWEDHISFFYIPTIGVQNCCFFDWLLDYFFYTLWYNFYRNCSVGRNLDMLLKYILMIPNNSFLK